MNGLIDTASSRLPDPHTASVDPLPFRGTLEDHKYLINACHRTMLELIKDERIQVAGGPTLIHPDYHKRNIFLSPNDPKSVTSLIDWQLACIEPAFIYTHSTPDFASLPDVNPADESEPQKLSKEEQDLQQDLSICNRAYSTVMRLETPKVKFASRLDPTLFRLFHYCFTTWRDGIPAIRQELLDLNAHWKELGL